MTGPIREDVLSLLRKAYGSLTRALVESLKRPPRRLYARVNTLKVSIREVVRMLSEDGVEAFVDENIPDAIYFNVEGPYTLECSSNKHVIVDLQTGISLMLGSDLYRPGVLKMNEFEKGDRLLAITPEGTPVACLEAAVSSRQAKLMRKGTVGVNISSPYRAPKISGTRAYAKGYIYPQSAPSIITSHVLNPREGMLVVDMNAAPGGKTSHIVQLTRGKARVLAFDRSERKILLLTNTLNKLGLNVNVIAIPSDSRYIHLDYNLVGKADRILIDPPCSNLGVRPVISNVRGLHEVLSLARYQRQFLKAASKVLRKGGLLVYSTCTLTLEENELNVLYAAEELGFTSYELPEDPPYAEKVVYKGIVGYKFTPLKDDMPGYFIAVLTK